MVCACNELFNDGKPEAVKKEFDLAFALDSSKRDDLDGYTALIHTVNLKMHCARILGLNPA